MMSTSHLRVTKRIPKSCYDCYKRRVKCNKQIPCDVCIRRGLRDTCRREKVIVNGKVVNGNEETESLRFKNELLERETRYLRAKLKMLENPTPVKLKKSNEFGYYGMVVTMMTRNKVPLDENVEFDYPMFEQLSSLLTFDLSYHLIKFNLDEICFLHGVILPEIFLQEHEHFFKEGGEHLNTRIEKTRDEYLWLSIYYALISNSLFLLDDSVKAKIGLSEEQCNFFGEIATFASSECLHRGQWLKYPNIKSLQVFCILATCFCSSSGVHIESGLLNSMIYIARTLNLDKLVQPSKNLNLLNFELSCRIWHILVIVDWLNDSSENRPSLIGLHDFTTPKPRNISDYNLMNSIDQETDDFLPITYNSFIYEMARCKKQFYFNPKKEFNENNLEFLDFAYISILSLEQQTVKYNMNSCKKFLKFLLNLKFYYEKLVISMQILAVKMNQNKAIDEEREICTHVSTRLIEEFNDLEYPNFYKKYWFVSEHAINGSIFLLVDMLLHQNLINLKKIKLIETFVLNLEVFLKLNSNPISNTIVLIRSLLEALEKTIHKESFKFELIEVNNVLNTLRNFQKIYDYESNSSDDFLIDSRWNEFLEWINTEC